MQTPVRFPTLPIQPGIFYFGTPVVLVTTINPDGSSNITPLSSAWALANRVVLGLANEGQGLANLQREHECVLNLPGPDLWPQVERLAPTTGRAVVPEWKRQVGYRYVGDKFALAGLTPCPSECVRPPRIAECPLQLEARVLSSMEREVEAWAGTAGGYHIIEVEVLRTHAHTDVVVPGTQHINPRSYRPLIYLFRHYTGTTVPLGRTFKAEV